MKKGVTEIRTFCDFCEEPAGDQCLVCSKDLCPEHRLVLQVCLEQWDKVFRAYLCPIHARPFLPLLSDLKGKSKTWEQVGHNPEFNEARLMEILAFLTKKSKKGEI